MSAIAQFIRIPKSEVEQLRSNYVGVMESGEAVAQYDFSGYVLATFLSCLDERNILLGQSAWEDFVTGMSRKQEISIFVLTSEHRDAYLARLSPDQFSAAELQLFYNDFNGCSEGPEVGETMLSGVTVFRESLTSLHDDDSVVICSIG